VWEALGKMMLKANCRQEGRVRGGRSEWRGRESASNDERKDRKGTASGEEDKTRKGGRRRTLSGSVPGTSASGLALTKWAM
jgi:hypothetical protein